MSTITTNGPPLLCKSGMTAYPNYPVQGACSKFGTPYYYTDGYQWTRTVTKATAVKRAKPTGLALLLNQTAWNWSETFRIRSTEYGESGNFYACPSQASPTPPADANPVFSAALSGSVSNLLRSVKDEKWNLSTFLGELPETFRFLAKVSSGLIESYRAVKRGDMRKLRNMAFPLKGGKSYRGGTAISARGRLSGRGLKNVQDRSTVADNLSARWLEWRYAVSPMIYDLDDALSVLYDSRIRLLITHRTGAKSESYVGSLRSPNASRSFSYRASVTTGIYFSVNPKVDSFKRLGLLNPLATLYELTPFSFVVDWFYDVGNYIASLDAMAGVTVYSSYQVTKIVEQTSARVPSVSSMCGTRYSTEGRYVYKSYSRTPSPSLSVPLPSFQLGLNAHRLVDAISLVKQLTR